MLCWKRRSLTARNSATRPAGSRIVCGCFADLRRLDCWTLAFERICGSTHRRRRCLAPRSWKSKRSWRNTMTFKALLATKTDKTISTSLVDVNEHDLMPGDVTIAVDYSTVNYKDALAVTGRAEVIRQFPLIAGIDLAGTVQASTHPGIAVGDRVVANGWGLSQTHHGGYAQKARMNGEWLVKIPDAFSTRDAMAIGTAGYTAMLSVL